MADYIRKKRNLKYRDPECKRYVRKDFEKKCAYCGVREGDLVGEINFQVDHFIPQAKGGEDVYDNLFYSCSTCNGKSGKSDYVSETLLNPCKDDIFNNGRIFCNEEFKYISNDVRGEEFINAIKLNRVDYIRRRKIINEYKVNAEKKIKEMNVLLKSIKDKRLAEIVEKTIEESKIIINTGKSYLFAFNEDDRIEELLESELSKFCSFKRLNGDYNIDYKIEQNGKPLYIHNVNSDFSFQGNIATRQIKNEDIEKWKNMEYSVKLIFFDKTSKKFYYAGAESSANSSTRSNVYITKENVLGISIFD